MTEVISFDSLKTIISNLKSNDIKYLIFGTNPKETSTFITSNNQKPTSLLVRFLIKSSIGSFYFSKTISLSDEDKVKEIKEFIANLNLIPLDIYSKNSIIKIK